LNFLNKNKVIADTQFGFKKGVSAIDAVLRLMEDVFGAFERQHIATVIFCDLSKAFDCVSHELLCERLQYYGIRGPVFDLLKSYLSGRQQLVDFNGCRSNYQFITSGVPQGSIIGPLLFTLYVNELPNTFSSDKTIQYADDTTVYTYADDPVVSEGYARHKTEELKKWFQESNLYLNLDKTETLNFTLKKIPNNSHTIKFLGIFLDQKLNFKHHINVLANKLSSTTYLLRNLASFINRSQCRMAYMGLFQGQLNYGIILWGNTPEAKSIFKIQKMALRAILKLNRSTPCKEYFIKIQILTVPALYIYQCLIHIKKNYNKFTTHSMIHQHYTRHKNAIVIPEHRLTATHNSFLCVAIKLYNVIPSYIQLLSLNKFKVEIKNILLQQAPYTVEEFLSNG
jgi:hypothetical protein